jgi:hypothetical protein
MTWKKTKENNCPVAAPLFKIKSLDLAFLFLILIKIASPIPGTAYPGNGNKLNEKSIDRTGL